MTYNQTPPPKRKPSVWAILGIIAAVIFILCMCGGIISAVSGAGTPKGSGRGLSVVDAPASDSGTSPTATPKPKAQPTPDPVLSTRDISLKVKITSKECFGSAGCNLQYTINDAAVTSVALIPDECDVTYEVKGFDDGTQIHTLTMRDDGTYEQDGYQSGSTSGSGKKLTVKVTDVVCR